jgi:hypothetical protein
MKDLQKPFSDFIKELIINELNETQQEQFSIEGEELIASLFTSRRKPVYKNEKGYEFDFGLSPSALALQNQGVTFQSIILTSFSLIQIMYVNKAQQNSLGYNDVASWKEFFSSINAKEADVELLCYRYRTQFANILELI